MQTNKINSFSFFEGSGQASPALISGAGDLRFCSYVDKLDWKKEMNRAASSSKHLHNPFNKRAMTMIQLKRIEKDVSFCTQHIPITSYSIYIYIYVHARVRWYSCTRVWSTVVRRSSTQYIHYLKLCRTACAFRDCCRGFSRFNIYVSPLR